MVKKCDYVDALKKGVYEICFEKKDGSFRVMKCTLMSSLIPKRLDEVNEELLLTPKRKSNPNVVCAFDLEKQSWRSFRVESVATFKEITTG